MTNVVIKKVSIKMFRNLRDVEFDLYGNTAFFGQNRLGKSNILNAISWCLTSYDLAGNSKDLLNVPYSIADCLEEKEVCVDVTVVLNVGTINRKVIFSKGSYCQSLAINGIDCPTIKAGETQIDVMLGIIGLSLSGNKDFNVRRFLLNPLYFTQCKESAFREFIINQIKPKMTTDVYRTLPEAITYVIPNENVNLLSQNNAKDIKRVKANAEYWNIVKDYITKFKDSDAADLTAVGKHIEDEERELYRLTDVKVAIDKYALALSKVYNELCKEVFSGIDIVLLEKGQGEDVWKDVCIINSPLTCTRMEYCSTSESIISGCSFIQSFIDKYDNVSHLPLLFDEFETLDSNSIDIISSKVNTQMISARVDSSSVDIGVEEF